MIPGIDEVLNHMIIAITLQKIKNQAVLLPSMFQVYYKTISLGSLMYFTFFLRRKGMDVLDFINVLLG